MPIPSGDQASWLAAYKVDRKMTGTDAARDAQINSVMGHVVAWAEKFCGRTLVDTTVTTATAHLDGQGSPTLVLEHTPVVAITSVSILDDSGASTTLDSGSYRCHLGSGILSMVGSAFAISSAAFSDAAGISTVEEVPAFPRGFRNIVVVYTYGVASYAAIPDDIKWAIFQATDRALGFLGVRDANYKGQTDGGDTQFRMDLFRPYRANVIA